MTSAFKIIFSQETCVASEAYCNKIITIFAIYMINSEGYDDDTIYSIEVADDAADLTELNEETYDDTIDYVVIDGTVSSVTSGDYFKVEDSDGEEHFFYFGYEDDDVECVVYDVDSGDGAADELAKKDEVKIACIKVYGDYYALAVYITG